MRRKEVSRRLTAVAEVRASLETHCDTVCDLLDGRPASRDAGGFSYRAHFDRMDRELARVEGILVPAEDAHVRNLVRIVELRRDRDELAVLVYDKQTSARQVLVGLYGADRIFELAAAAGKTPQGSQPLGEQVGQTVTLLRHPAVALPPVKVDGVWIDFQAMAAGLERDNDRLIATRAELQRATKAADGTRVLTRKAIEDYDGVFPWVAADLESLFRLAGEKDLADRIRTSARRVTRRQAEAEEAPPEGAEAGEADTSDTSDASDSSDTSDSSDRSDRSDTSDASAPADA